MIRINLASCYMFWYFYKVMMKAAIIVGSLFLLSLAIFLSGCTSAPAETADHLADASTVKARKPQAESQVDIEEIIDKLVDKLADEKYATRETADKVLREILFHDARNLCSSFLRLKYHFDTTTDPEVKIRLERVIEQLSTAWKINKIDDESAGSPLIFSNQRTALEEVAQLVGGRIVQVNSDWLKVVIPMPEITIDVDGADLRSVLNQIASVGGTEVFIAPDVMGQVSIKLKNVPWRTAFDTIIKCLGFLVVEDDNILRVVHPEPLTEK